MHWPLFTQTFRHVGAQAAGDGLAIHNPVANATTETTNRIQILISLSSQKMTTTTELLVSVLDVDRLAHTLHLIGKD